ncbi:hypothetical protein GALL_419770 [mine drainage metagenome]|uniref:Uncharacterized protein n=1 Tax=mine drainage metagenome TaxID=410659 RepID=A0A1J5PZ54_9ZZZZ
MRAPDGSPHPGAVVGTPPSSAVAPPGSITRVRPSRAGSAAGSTRVRPSGAPDAPTSCVGTSSSGSSTARRRSWTTSRGDRRADACGARADRSACAVSGPSPTRSGSPERARASTTSTGRTPKGARPVAANASTAAQPHQSLVGDGSAPSSSSGGRYPGVPATSPTLVTRASSADCAIPKSIRTGPSSVSMMLLGLRSRWTTPAACTAASASSRPAARSASASASSGPARRTRSSRVSPSTSSVTRNASVESASASSTAATAGCRNRWSAAASRRRRSRATGSAPMCGCRSLSATTVPPPSTAR